MSSSSSGHGMILLIVYLCIAIFVSFFCSIAEAVLLSVRPSYVENLEREGRKGGKTLKKLRDNLNRPLAAILTANTIAHTVGAAGVGAQAASLFGNQYLGVVSAVLTFLILIFSEIIPKTIGALYWQKLAPNFAILIEFLSKALFPFVWLSEHLTQFIAGKGKKGFTFSRSEIEAMAEIGAREGLLQAKELRIVSNLMRLHKLSVRDIMTPRPVVFTVPENMTVAEFFSQHSATPFSRIPLYRSNPDNISGYVLKFEVLLAHAEGKLNAPLAELMRDIEIVSNILSASSAFDRLVHKKNHIALVVDEYGTLQGLITLEDVIETLIGLEITDELDNVEDMQALAHDRWRKRMQDLGIDIEALSR